MLIRVILALVMFASIEVSARPFNGIEWKVESKKYEAVLSWQPEESINVEFYKQAGLPMEFRVTAPNLVAKADEAALFVMNSPLKVSKRKEPVGRIQKQRPDRLADGRRVVFSESAPLLLDAMAAGDWGVIEMEMPSGVLSVLEIPAIDFIKPLEEFNNRRSAFPLLGWEQGSDYQVYFDVAQYELGEEQKRGLKDLVDLIAYDGEVRSIEIDGHSDITGHRLQNLTLSQQRAHSVRQYLSGLGVEEALFSAVRHHGQRYPISGAAHQENRRVDVKLFR